LFRIANYYSDERSHLETGVELEKSIQSIEGFDSDSLSSPETSQTSSPAKPSYMKPVQSYSDHERQSSNVRI
jgi:hypothetical protein